MKYFSELLNSVFDSAEECEEAEAAKKEEMERAKAEKEALAAKAKAEREQAAAERKADAKEIEELIKARREIDKQINAKTTAFVNKHGSFHYSVKEPLTDPFETLFDLFFNPFF